MRIGLIWTITIVVAGLNFPQKAFASTRDLQEPDESIPTLQETQDRIAACPQCRSADEIQQNGLLRSLVGHSILWLFNRRQDDVWILKILQDREIPVDSSKWENLIELWTAMAQSLRREEDANDTASFEVKQYQYLLIDLLASSLEAGSTLMGLLRDNMTQTTAPMLSFSCCVMTMNDFVNRIIISNIALVVDELHALSSGDPVNAISLMVNESWDRADGKTAVLDRYKDILLSSCAASDDSFDVLRDSAEALTLELQSKKDAFLSYSTEQKLPSTFPEFTCAVFQRIRNVLAAIFIFPFAYFIGFPFLFFIIIAYDFDGPIWQLVVLEALFILIIIILFPIAYPLTILLALLGVYEYENQDDDTPTTPCETTPAPLEEGAVLPNGGMENAVAFAKVDPFALSMDDIKCQMQAIACQSDAWAQRMTP